MSQESILDYLRRTPHNTNVNVVKGMIGGTGDSLPEVTEADDGKVLTVVDGQWSKAEGGGDKGYECTETRTTLTEESVDVESEMQGVYVGRLQFVFTNIPSETLFITFNGVKYDCNRISAGDGYAYGGYGEFGPDFSIYPFIIFVGVSELTQLATETAGTYSIKIEADVETIETTECFKKAIHSVVAQYETMTIHNATAQIGGDSIEAEFIDVYKAFLSGKRVIVVNAGGLGAFEVTSVVRGFVGGGTVIGGNGHVYTASSDDAYPSYSNGSGDGSESAA